MSVRKKFDVYCFFFFSRILLIINEIDNSAHTLYCSCDIESVIKTYRPRLREILIVLLSFPASSLNVSHKLILLVSLKHDSIKYRLMLNIRW